MTVFVYTQPNCQPCLATKRLLGRLGVDYTEIDLTAESREVVEAFIAEGLKEAPIVVTSDGRKWSGYRPDRLHALAA